MIYLFWGIIVLGIFTIITGFYSYFDITVEGNLSAFTIIGLLLIIIALLFKIAFTVVI